MENRSTVNIPTIFEFEQWGVRVIEKNGEPWFAGIDIAILLGYSNPQKAIRDHCKGVNETLLPSCGGEQVTKIIPERDLYRLIMRSKLPSAERFEEWVVSEVLPTIRRTGTFQVATQIPQTLPEALRLAADLADQVETQKKEMIEMRPKVEALDLLSNTDGTLCLRDAAKALNIPPHKFNQSLQASGWIYKRPGKGSFIAYQARIQAGYLVHKITTIPVDGGDDRISEQVRITSKGLTKLAESVFKGAGRVDS